jgi:hypothetical protein
MAVCDMDHDGLPEIVKDIVMPYGDLGIYESVGDNQYDLIFVDDPDTNHNDAPRSTIAMGDFDQDSLKEFVIGDEEWYWIYECTGPNSYEKIAEGTLPTLNIFDCCAATDVNQNGKWEFVVKGFIVPTSQINVFIFEASGNNTYDTIQTFTLWKAGIVMGGLHPGTWMVTVFRKLFWKQDCRFI